MKNSKIYFLCLLAFFIVCCGGMSEKQIQEKKSAEEAVSALKKLDAATEVGINKSDYSKMLIDALPVVNQSTEKLPEGELKTEIKSAMDTFMDAKTIWSIMGDDTDIFACEKQPDTKGQSISDLRFLELMCNTEGGNLLRKYQLPLRPYRNQQKVKDGQGAIIKKEGISIIWSKAKEHINHASSLLDGKK